MKKLLTAGLLVLFVLDAAVCLANVSLQSFSFPTHFVRHRGGVVDITEIYSPQDRADASFRIVPGLADPSKLSFESVSFPGHFLRHQNFRLMLHPFEESPLFRADATFRQVPGFADPSWVTFESHNFPGRFLRHRNYNIWLDAPGPGPFPQDATFRIVGALAGVGPGAVPPPPPGAPGGPVLSLRSMNFPSHFVRHRQNAVMISGIASPQDQQDATFRMIPGLADPNMVSFESVNYPGQFLRAIGGRVELQPFQDTYVFRSDATFQRVPGLANTALASFTLHNRPGVFLRHRNLMLHAEGHNTPEFPADATFELVPR